jgi:hypothetical protein
VTPKKDAAIYHSSRSVLKVTPNGSLPADAQASAALNLRPLPLGELLDRAFTLYFKNIVPFSALLGVVLIPSIVVSYLQTRDFLGFYIYLIQHQLSSPNSTPDLTKLSSLAPSDALTGLQFALALIVVPLSYAAVVVGVSRAYVGLPVTFADCYRQALHRWLPIFMLIIVWTVLVVGSVLIIFIATAIAAAIFGVTLAAIGGTANSPAFAVFFAILIIAAMLAAISITIMLYLTWAISFVGVVLEKTDPFRAIGAAFSRVFGGRQFWRGFVLALALTGIYFGATIVIGGGGALLAYLLKAPALYVIFLGFMQLFFVPFAVVTAAVYYYDIRIRREGYDLQMLADQLAVTKPSSTAGV